MGVLDQIENSGLYAMSSDNANSWDKESTRNENKEEALLKAPPMDDAAAVEAEHFVRFVLNDAAEMYREPLKDLYHTWQDLNEEHFFQRLEVPHITIAAGPPQALGYFKRLTDYGGRIQITIDARIFAARRKFVVRAWPAEGNCLFVRDVLLHEMIHQYLAEIEHYDDRENRKHGEGFADACNRIGRSIGLARVYTRRRRQTDRGKPLANTWPINVRPADYYLGHVLSPRQPRNEKKSELRGVAGTMSFFAYLIECGEVGKLESIIRRESERVFDPVRTVNACDEKGSVSHFNPTWLTWNDRCVGKLLHAICKRGMMDLMPLLADALEAAGCGDELLLAHCRTHMRHTGKCWVLRSLLGKT